MTAPRPHPRSPSKAVVVASLVLSAMCITTVAIVLSRSIPATKVVTADDVQKQWDAMHHDRVVAMKRDAEALTLEGNLREAHAKYAEIDALVGQRKVLDPSLAEIISAARDDRDSVYKLMLKRLEQPEEAPAEVEPPPATLPVANEAIRPPPATAPVAHTGASASGYDMAPPPAPLPRVITPPVTKPAATREEFTITPGQVPRGPISDADVGLAIQLGVDYLLSHFDEQGELQPKEERDRGSGELHRQGLNALCVYALASAERAIKDPRLSPRGPQMDRMLEKLKEFDLGTNRVAHGPATYSRSLRACALATFNRPQDRAQLQDDVDWLINANTGGAYTYDDRFAPPRKSRIRRPATRPSRRPSARVNEDQQLVHFAAAPRGDARRNDRLFQQRRDDDDDRLRIPRVTPPPNRNAQWDNSNSQYGLLGVWAGADVGIEVPDNYWRLVQRHWSSCQLPDGTWAYSARSDNGYFAMTVAGVASLLVTHDYLEAPLMGGKRSFTRDPYPPALTAGLKWLEEDDNAMKVESAPLFYVGYNLFGIERVALASGFKQFGRHDWFVELGVDLLASQNADGSFSPTQNAKSRLIETAYALLFLSRGRHPILMNKLRFDEYWTNRPREVSNLANFVGKDLERPINWQVVDVRRDAKDWADAPILFIASHKAPRLDDQQIRKLREFAETGGLILTHADLGSQEFNTFTAELSKRLFPRYPLVDLPTEHPIYTLNYVIDSPRPRLQGASNGTRLLLLHSPTDISAAWQTRAVVSRKEMFELGINIYLYATGKQRFRNRLDTAYVPDPPADDSPAHVLNLARLRYSGGGGVNWDPEPAAWPRAARKLQWETGLKLNVHPTDVAHLNPAQFQLAHVTGTTMWTPSPAEIEAIKSFVSAGGTLVVEAAGGSGTFADAENSWLPQVLGTARLQSLEMNDPLLKKSVDGTVDVPQQALRLFALEQLRSDGSRIKSATLGKGRVIFSGLDLSSGLLGTSTWGVLGYLPEYSEAVVRNLLLTTAAGR